MGFDYRKFTPEIIDKTIGHFQKKYPDLTREEYASYIVRHHANLKPESEKEAFVRIPLAEIEKAVAKGWLK